METSKGSGMQTMEMALKAAVAKRQISRQQAIAFSNNPNLFKNDTANKRPGPPGRRR
jgi:Tfp pilus assembly pilus retraction ATPase PilT